MKSRLALLAVPFLALACTDAEQATLLEPPAISADVLITNFVLSHVECAIGQTGFVRYIVEVSSGGVDKERTFPCPQTRRPNDQIEDLTAFGVVEGFTVIFENIDNLPSACATVTHDIADVPFKTKCTVNGLEANGKPLGSVAFKYVQPDEDEQ